MQKIKYDYLKFWFDEDEYKPSDPAIALHKELIRPRFDKDGNPVPVLVVLAGGEQAGKSWTGGYHIYAMHPWGKIFWIVGDRYEDTRNEFKYLTEAGIRAGAMEAKNCHMPVSTAHPCSATFNNGAIVRTLSSADASTLAGQSPDGILMVEAGRQSYQAFRVLWTRAQHATAWFLVSGTFESTKGRWFPDLWRECQGDNEYLGRGLSLPSYSNPKLYPLGANDPKILSAKRTLTEEEFAERFMGVPRPTIGIVFPEFRRSTHVRLDAEYDPQFPVRLWVDPGYDHAYAVLFVQIINDQVRIFKEIYVQGMINEQVISMVQNDALLGKIERVVIDIAANAHAGAQHPAMEEWRKAMGARHIPVTSQLVKIETGIIRTKDKLHTDPMSNQPYMIFHPRVTSTIAEFEEGYRYPVKRDGIVGKWAPIDLNNDSCKAIAYGLVDAFGNSDGPAPVQSKPIRRKMSFDRGR